MTTTAEVRPASLDDVVEKWTALLDGLPPLVRAQVAKLFCDPAMVRRNGEIRRGAIFEATRQQGREAVAAALGVTVSAVDKAIEVHNRTARAATEQEGKVRS